MKPHSTGSHVHDDAGLATAEQGIVMLDGPNGVAVSMTPAAARATGEGLVAAAKVAETQRPKH